MTPTTQWGVGIIAASLVFLAGERFISVRNMEARVSALEQVQIRHDEAIIRQNITIDKIADILLDDTIPNRNN